MTLLIALMTMLELCAGDSDQELVSNFSSKVIHPAIIDGYPATMKEFPYAVRLYIQSWSQVTICSGEAVHVKLVITAAHCLHQKSTAVVVTGDADHSDYLAGKHIKKYARYRISKIFLHPGFDKTEYVHDVALAKTTRKMNHPGHAIISPSYIALEQPVEVHIFGWGSTEKDLHNNKLFGKKLFAQNCSQMTATGPHNYICLMDRGICHGDSGGGLVYEGKLYGIASFYDRRRHDDHKKEYTYFYTSLAEEKDFVQACIEKNDSNRIHKLQTLIAGILFVLLYVITLS